MELQSPDVKADLAVRLRRIEGQVRGVQRMVEDGRECADILQQMTAIRSAVYQASLVLARDYAARCLEQQAASELGILLDGLMATIRKLE